MSEEEVESIVRALAAVTESLQANAARQSMQEAFTQVKPMFVKCKRPR